MKILLAFIVSLQSLNSVAQLLPAFKSLRYDEDYSFLKNDSSTNWYKATKFKKLANDDNTYVSIGGDIRLQYLRFKNENWGALPRDKDGYTLTRYLLHADLHTGKYLRVFGQLQSSQIDGKAGSSPVDENPLELHQLFAELNVLPKSAAKLAVRVGRQELVYGSQRLISFRDGPNNRQSFDGVKVIFNKSGYNLDLLYTHSVASKKGIFDDGFNKDVKLWGAYLVKNDASSPVKFDLYYLGLRKNNAKFDDGNASEVRHSAGTRLWNTKKNLRYDIEGVWQFGKFGTKSIEAWTLSLNSGYKFSNIKYKPEAGLKTELISGDAQYEDNKLQTFNPLFPRGGYFGLVSLIGPANLFDIHPSLVFELNKKLFMNLDYDIFWRYSSKDGLYGPNVAMLFSGKASVKKFVGKQLSGDMVYTPNQFLYFRAEVTWFTAGAYLKALGPGKDILFTALTAQVRF